MAWSEAQHNLMAQRLVNSAVVLQDLRRAADEMIEIIQTHDATNQPTWINYGDVTADDLRNLVTMCQDIQKFVTNQNVQTADRRPVIQAAVSTVGRP